MALAGGVRRNLAEIEADRKELAPGENKDADLAKSLKDQEEEDRQEQEWADGVRPEELGMADHAKQKPRRSQKQYAAPEGAALEYRDCVCWAMP